MYGAVGRSCRHPVSDIEYEQRPAVRATRAQMDRRCSRALLPRPFQHQGLRIWRDNVTEVLTASGRACGVRTALGLHLRGQGMCFCLRHISEWTHSYGNGQYAFRPSGEMLPSLGLSDSLRELGFELGRLKTGTTPRILRSSIDFFLPG